MKLTKFLYTILFIFTIHALHAQENASVPVLSTKNEVSLIHNWTHMGRDIEVGYTYRLKNFGIKLGLNYFQNSPILDNQDFVYKNRFRAFDTRQRFGANLSYSYAYQLPASDLVLVPYIKAQYFKLGVQNELSNQTIQIPSINVFTITTGLEAKTKLYQSIYLTGAIGSGIFWVTSSREVSNNLFNRNYDWEFLVDYRMGIAYQF